MIILKNLKIKNIKLFFMNFYIIVIFKLKLIDKIDA